MTEAKTPPVPPAAKKAAAKKAAVKKTVAKTVAKKDHSEPVLLTVTLKGEQYQLRGTQYLVTKVMSAFSEISEWAEGRDEDDTMTHDELRQVSEGYESVIKLFNTRDATADRACSRDRLMAGLEEGDLDFGDLSDAFNKMGGVKQGRSARPLG